MFAFLQTGKKSKTYGIKRNIAFDAEIDGDAQLSIYHETLVQVLIKLQNCRHIATPAARNTLLRELLQDSPSSILGTCYSTTTAR
jgi:hypothetical protein